MNDLPKPSAVLFAKDVSQLAHFYSHVVEMVEIHRDEAHVVLDSQGFQLVIHAIPSAIASQIEITSPPELRAETPIKLCLPVMSIDQARAQASELGGQIGAKGQEWEARSFRACDGYDPEGNVFQVREAKA